MNIPNNNRRDFIKKSALGAIGLTLVMHTLRFANFSHAELLSVGAYAALVFDGLFGALYYQLRSNIDPLSLTWSLILAIAIAMIATGLSAILIDKLVFRKIREKGDELSMVFASFGVAMVVRNLISLFFGLKSVVRSTMPTYRATRQDVTQEMEVN